MRLEKFGLVWYLEFWRQWHEEDFEMADGLRYFCDLYKSQMVFRICWNWFLRLGRSTSKSHVLKVLVLVAKVERRQLTHHLGKGLEYGEDEGSNMS